MQDVFTAIADNGYAHGIARFAGGDTATNADQVDGFVVKRDDAVAFFDTHCGSRAVRHDFRHGRGQPFVHEVKARRFVHFQLVTFLQPAQVKAQDFFLSSPFDDDGYVIATGCTNQGDVGFAAEFDVLAFHGTNQVAYL